MHTAKRARKPSGAKRFAEVENISILGITERMGPLGLQLYSESYFAAAQALPTPQVPFEPVRPYLVCHAIELGLKAFLSLKGRGMIALSEGPFGHKLSTILSEAEATGLLDAVPLSATHRDAIKTAETYYAGKVFEYPAVGEALSAYPSMPPLNSLFEAAALLTSSLAQPCREAK
ncbi:hypothetical protein [Inhella sp.]|jgi:hypothetical protein|uniref:hypothetical protein n=1 Tax=Inhella sp. TaxID=1921806 RepID=UPI00391F1553